MFSNLDSLPIPDLIEVWSVEQNRPFVLENGLIRGGFCKSGQKEFHGLMVAVEVVQGHRQKDLPSSIIGKRRHPATEGFLRLLIRSYCPLGASQAKQCSFEILA